MVDKCLRCGRCCHTIHPETKKVMRCKYLKEDGDKFICSIYKDRLGKAIFYAKNKVGYCSMRKRMCLNLKGCPYNKPNQEVMEVGY